MIQIETQQLKDFQTCERLYDFRHLQKLPETIGERKLNSFKFETTIKAIVNHFFYQKQNGRTPSYASLLHKWEKLWFPKDTTPYDIVHEQHESLYGNMASLTSKAAAVLLEVVENFSDPDIIPMGIGLEYTAPVTPNIGVNDMFDLVYKKNGKVYVVKWVFNHKLKFENSYVIDFALMHVGYFNKFGDRIKDTKFGYFDLMNQKSGFNEVVVQKADIEALKYWCDSLHDEKIFPSRRGLTAYCKVCPYDKPCSKWVLWAKKEKDNG